MKHCQQRDISARAVPNCAGGEHALVALSPLLVQPALRLRVKRQRHGGPDDGAEPHEITKVGDDVTVKEWAVGFRSKVGNGVVIGVRAYVDGSHLLAGRVVPERAIMIKDKMIGYVEW